MKRTTLAVTVLICLVTLTLPLTAQEPAPDQEPSPIQIVARFLQLSDDQLHQFETLLNQRRDTFRAIAEQIRPLEDQLRHLLNSDNPDPAAVGRMVLQIHGLQQQIHQAQENFLTAFRNLLNDDQKVRVAGVQRAARLVPVIGAFARLGLLPPPEERPRQSSVPPDIPPELFELENQ